MIANILMATNVFTHTKVSVNTVVYGGEEKNQKNRKS